MSPITGDPDVIYYRYSVSHAVVIRYAEGGEHSVWALRAHVRGITAGASTDAMNDDD